ASLRDFRPCCAWSCLGEFFACRCGAPLGKLCAKDSTHGGFEHDARGRETSLAAGKLEGGLLDIEIPASNPPPRRCFRSGGAGTMRRRAIGNETSRRRSTSSAHALY